MSEGIKSKHEKLKYLSLIIIAAILFTLIGYFLLIKREKPNFVIVVVDTLREDLGGANPPFFESLKVRGKYFSNCFTTIPITLPAHLSLLTSKLPPELHVVNNGMQYKEGTKLLQEILREKGYTTMAIVSLGTLQASTGISRGFQYFNNSFPKTRWYRTAKEINSALLPMLSNLKRPFFLWVHYSDPHEPYVPPYYRPDSEIFVQGKKKGEITFLKEEKVLIKNKSHSKIKVRINIIHKIKDALYSIKINGKKFPIEKNYFQVEIEAEKNKEISLIPEIKLSVAKARKFYKEEVVYWDREFRKLYKELKKRGLLRNTYIFILADHGEGLGEWKGHIGHILFLNGVYMRIPMLFLSPNGKIKGIDSRLCSIMDVFPTVLELARIKSSHKMRGFSLLGKKKHKSLYLQTFRPEAFFDRFSIIKPPFQLIYTPINNFAFFFNIEKDRLSLKPIKFNSQANEMMKDVLEYERFARRRLKKRIIDKKSLEMLRSLGYVR